jgi:hypothetical protein
MPTCAKCGVMQATIEMRRSPKKDESGADVWLCKSQGPCKQRRAAQRANQIALKKGK